MARLPSMYNKRWEFWRASLKGWWLLLSVILWFWGVLGNVRGDFIADTDQVKYKLPVLFPQIEWYWLIAAFLLITVIALLEGSFRAHRRAIDALKQELAALRAELDKERTTPCFQGAIEAAQAGPIFSISGNLAGSHIGCEVMVLIHFANVSRTPTSIRDIRLKVAIGDKIHLMDLADENRGLQFIDDAFRRRPLLGVAELGDIAEQGRVFEGLLRFSLENRLIKKDDKINIECAIIAHAFGQHEIKPTTEGLGLVELSSRERFYTGTWYGYQERRPRLAEAVPPLILSQEGLSTEQRNLIREYLSSGSRSRKQAHPPQSPTDTP